MHFLFPSDPFDPRRQDETFREQADEIRRLGTGVSTVPLEELEEDTCRLRGPIPANATVVYRGCMLAATEYERLARLIRSHRAVPPDFDGRLLAVSLSSELVSPHFRVHS